MITLLGSLSESYQFLITALISRFDTLTGELMASRLLHEDMIHSDVCGFMKTSTLKRKRHFITLADDKSHFCVEYLMRNKSKVVTKFVEFVALSETQTGQRIKTLRSDHGGESFGVMAKFCKDRGIEKNFTPPYTPQLNMMAERTSRTLVECARCMLEHAGASRSLHGKALMTAMFFRNRCPTCAIS